MRRTASPQDDHIDKSACLERWFPTADRFAASEMVAIVAAAEDSVFLLYDETQVFFGGGVG